MARLKLTTIRRSLTLIRAILNEKAVAHCAQPDGTPAVMPMMAFTKPSGTHASLSFRAVFLRGL